MFPQRMATFPGNSGLFDPFSYLQNLPYDCSVVRGEYIPRRPPVDFRRFYEDSVSFAEDCFVVRTHDNATTIPPLSATYSTRSDNPYSLFVADEEGWIHLRNTLLDSPYRGHRQSWHVNNNAIFSLTAVPNDPQNRLLTCSGDRNLALFDPETTAPPLVVAEGEDADGPVPVPPLHLCERFEGHFGSVKCSDFQPDNSNVFVSGARDGHIMLWDVRSNAKGGSHAPVGYIVNAHRLPLVERVRMTKAAKESRARSYKHAPTNSQPYRSIDMDKFCTKYGCKPKKNEHQEILAVVFRDQYTFLSTGTADCTIKMWDLRKITEKADALHTISLAKSHAKQPGETLQPFTSLCLDVTKTHLFASNFDKTIYRFDVGPRVSSKPTAQYHGANVSSFYVKCSLSPDGETLACGSNDDTAYLFSVRKPYQAPVKLVGHEKEVMSITFNQYDPYQFASVGDDDKVLIWHGEPFLDRSNPPDIIGRTKIDERSLEERKPKRRSREFKLQTADPNSPTVATWVRQASKRRADSENERSPSPKRPPTAFVLKTPNRPTLTPSQRKKRYVNLTLSPFFKHRQPPATNVDG
ncbi:hypothetical protein RvY_15979 [Ramazzottius varieornatus]|uniref:Uncharacterized protein n=1 Tax=Ramazzottius varieornatus TaxID=947166 RepID=A0A1D1VZV1_RAMVA|nr:hypothetical protein RvY_15979 [Ramazzottius varieornatus]